MVSWAAVSLLYVILKWIALSLFAACEDVCQGMVHVDLDIPFQIVSRLLCPVTSWRSSTIFGSLCVWKSHVLKTWLPCTWSLGSQSGNYWEVEPTGRKLGHWYCAPVGILKTWLRLVSLCLLPGCSGVRGFAWPHFLQHQVLLDHKHKKQTSQETTPWNTWNQDSN